MDFRLSDELIQIQATARAFADEVLAPRARAADELGKWDSRLPHDLAQHHLLDERRSALALALIYEELGRVDSSARGFATVQISLVARCLDEWGSPEQKEGWLPRLRSGEAVGCYALTEPEAGSDIRSVRSRAERVNGAWELQGDKHWITNGGVAHVALVFANTAEGLTAFVVPTDTPGFVAEPMGGRDLGHRASNHAFISIRGVRLPESGVLGQVGSGFQVATSALGHGRLGVAAGAVGILQACLDATVDFARSRRQFGKRIGDFEMVQAAIADMVADLSAARLMVRYAAWLADSGEDNALAVASAKLFATEAALRTADQAILIHGARGYSSDYPVERYWRDAKGMQIYEGTAHVQRIIIARSLLGRDTIP